MTRLSPAMCCAVDLARENDGRLIRYGDYRYLSFWAEKGRVGHLVLNRISPRTIAALVSRGMAKYTNPDEVTLMDARQ